MCILRATLYNGELSRFFRIKAMVKVRSFLPTVVGMLAAVALVQNMALARPAKTEIHIVQSPTLTASDYFISAYQKNERGNYREALADYDLAIALQPNHVQAYFNRAILKNEKLNDPEGSLADYNRVIVLQSDLADAYYGRGHLKYGKLNDVLGALADYNVAIALKPDYVDAYINRGILKYWRLNDLQGALADYDRAIALTPTLADAYNGRGLLKYWKLDAQGALADYDRAIALQANYADAYANRGVLKTEQLNDPRGAIADLRQAAKLYRQQGKVQDLQTMLNKLRLLGSAE
jgi:tetratricopeptide (TPR) repeat protein